MSGDAQVVALLELGHPAALEDDRVDVAGDRQVVAQDDRVATLLGGPPADPVDPRPVAPAEHPVDEPVVRGQVVLGQEVDLEGRLGDAGQPRLVGRPGLLVEVAPEPVRDVVVGEPLLGDLGVAVVEAARLGLELDEQGLLVVGAEGVGRALASDAPRAGCRRAGEVGSSAIVESSVVGGPRDKTTNGRSPIRPGPKHSRRGTPSVRRCVPSCTHRRSGAPIARLAGRPPGLRHRRGCHAGLRITRIVVRSPNGRQAWPAVVLITPTRMGVISGAMSVAAGSAAMVLAAP